MVNLLPGKIDAYHNSNKDNPERKKEWVSRDSTSYGVTMLGDTVRLIKIGSTAGTAYSSETWVTWGWFEDNVLNKFTSFANDSEAVVTFRSIEPKITNDGEFIKDGEGNLEYESVKIKSHEMLKTVDAKKFILPGLYPNSFTDDDPIGPQDKITESECPLLSRILQESLVSMGPNGEEIKMNSKGQYYYKESTTGNAILLPEYKVTTPLKPFNVPGGGEGFNQKGYLRNVF